MEEPAHSWSPGTAWFTGHNFAYSGFNILSVLSRFGEESFFFFGSIILCLNAKRKWNKRKLREKYEKKYIFYSIVWSRRKVKGKKMKLYVNNFYVVIFYEWKNNHRDKETISYYKLSSSYFMLTWAQKTLLVGSIGKFLLFSSLLFQTERKVKILPFSLPPNSFFPKLAKPNKGIKVSLPLDIVMTMRSFQ